MSPFNVKIRNTLLLIVCCTGGELAFRLTILTNRLTKNAVRFSLKSDIYMIKYVFFLIESLPIHELNIFKIVCLCSRVN